MDQELVINPLQTVIFRLLAPAVLAGAFLFGGTARAQDPEKLRSWREYRTIMWIGDSAYKRPDKLPLFFQRLREMGINTAVVHNEADPNPIANAGFPFYVENIVNRGLCLKWNSPVTDWEKTVAAWGKTRDEESLIRPYTLNDPKWRESMRTTLERVVKRNAPFKPIAYDLRDELSTTISANPFDYDFSPVALEGFRTWLKTRYKDLTELNQFWETKFASWEEVRPFTTDQIKNRMSTGDAIPRGNPDWQALAKLRFTADAAKGDRTRWNLTPWVEHRTYMDVSLADALGYFRNAARTLDPETPVGIEGTQMPSAFGGYDLWRLSQVLDWVEPYDIGNAREIFGSFMPGKPILCTVGEKDGNAAARRLWHLLLMGDKGCIVWWSEDSIDWSSDEYALTPKAKALAPVLKEMTSDLAHLFLRAKKETDPIAIHYSQTSIQVNWLMESTVDGSSWIRRFSSYEASHNRMAKARNAWLKLVTDLGYTPTFVSSEQVVTGELQRGNYRVLIMPTSLATSDAETRAIRDWLFATPKQKRFLMSNGAPGHFDERGALRPKPAFSDLMPAFISEEMVVVRSSEYPSGELVLRTKGGDIREYSEERLREISADPSADPNRSADSWLGHFRHETGFGSLPVPVQIPPATRVAIHRYKLGDARLVAFERNISYQMSEELKQAGGNEALEKPIQFLAKLQDAAHVYDLRTAKYLGRNDQIIVDLDPWRPALYALLDEPVEEGKLIETLGRIANAERGNR